MISTTATIPFQVIQQSFLRRLSGSRVPRVAILAGQEIRQSKNHVEFSVGESRDRQIEKGQKIVRNIAAKLLRTGQKPYIEQTDIQAAGYQAMVQTIDGPSSDFPLAGRIAANARQAMIRFITKQVREYDFPHCGRAAHGTQPRAQGTVCPDGDTDGTNCDPMASRADVLKSRAALAHNPDKPAVRNRAAWRDAAVRIGWRRVNDKREPRMVSRAELQDRDWGRGHRRVWRDVRTASFDAGVSEYVLGVPANIDTFDMRIARRDGFIEKKYLEASRGRDYKFPGWVNGFRFSVTNRRTGETDFKDLHQATTAQLYFERPSRTVRECDVSRAVRALPPQQQRLVRLYYSLGLTCKDIASREGVEFGAVLDAVRSGRARVSSLLKHGQRNPNTILK